MCVRAWGEEIVWSVSVCVCDRKKQTLRLCSGINVGYMYLDEPPCEKESAFGCV